VLPLQSHEVATPIPWLFVFLAPFDRLRDPTFAATIPGRDAGYSALRIKDAA
jgi:hypothetical protein